MAYKASHVIEKMEKIAPLYLAEHWDNVGLQIGSKNKIVKKLLLCLDIDESVIHEAIEKNIDLIISHHPFMFKSIQKIDYDKGQGDLIRKIIQNDISIYAAHTNFDVAWGGTNDLLGSVIGLKAMRSLMKIDNEAYCKLVVFVPKSHLEPIREALSAYGGQIGNYKDCTFYVEGTGTFKPLKGTQPHIGTVDALERTAEFKIETIVSKANLNKTIQKVIEAHPYEEVAYDVYALDNEIQLEGLGRLGILEKETLLKDFVLNIKKNLDMPSINYAGKDDQIIKKVAICTGAGMDLLKDAIRNRCDCFVTGDIKYHEAQYALQNNIAVIDASHYHSEKLFAKGLKDQLEKLFKADGTDIEIIASSINTNPFDVL